MEICGDENTKYTQKQVKGSQYTLFHVEDWIELVFFFLSAAVQRKYESLRRLWKLEEEDNHREMQLRKAKEKKYRARRRRVRKQRG